MMIYDGIIVGGGASGMMTAIVAGRRGKKIAIVEHSDRLGKKLLQTGNGKCNFANYDMDIGNYQNDDKDFVGKCLEQFGVEECLEFFKGIGIFSTERNGYIYPHSETAASLQEALRLEILNLKTDEYLETDITGIVRDNSRNCFVIKTGKNTLYAKKIVLATGSKAAPKTGSDGSGYKLAQKLGIKVKKPLPALVALTSDNRYSKTMSGVRSRGTVSIYDKNMLIATDTGEIQYADYGISGIPVFQVSRFAVKALDEGRKITAVVDMLPDMEEKELKEYIDRFKDASEYKDIVQFFSGLVNKKLVTAVCQGLNINVNSKARGLEKSQLYKLVRTLKEYRFNITGSKAFDSAQVCQGGVILSQLDSSTMELKNNRGVYVVGELADVDGKCGGYNLMWCWASGYIAGRSI